MKEYRRITEGGDDRFEEVTERLSDYHGPISIPKKSKVKVDFLAYQEKLRKEDEAREWEFRENARLITDAARARANKDDDL